MGQWLRHHRIERREKDPRRVRMTRRVGYLRDG
uniref:Uncharacterized protein n=1 Tax=Rhizophora mucronata TaxID=61149 RepID=A0A2P2N6V4_RHIMU